MKTWKYCDYSQTVRQMPENYCLFSAKTFVNGGTYDAAALPEAEKNLRLAAAAPELLELLEEINSWDGLSTQQHNSICRAIAKAKGESKL